MTSVSHTPHADAGMAAGASQAGSPSWIVKANTVLGHVVAVPAALLVTAEITVLSAGIVARYVFRSPIVWSDELAGILFLWLAMLGSVIAFQRGEHMRMTAIVGVLSADRRAFLDVIAAAASLAFLVLVVWPAYEFAADEAFVTTPALEIVNTWRAAALPIGIGLMLVAAVLRLIRIANLRSLLSSLAIVAGIIAAFVLLAPVLKPLGNLNLLIFFVFVVGGMVFAAVPIAFAFGLATVGYLALTTSTPDVVMIGRMDEGMSHLILLAVPLFVFLGLLIEMTVWRAPWSASWRAFSVTSAAGCTTCSSGRCIWSPASPVPRRRTWLRWLRCCFPRCGSVGPSPAISLRSWPRRGRRPKRFRRHWF